MKSLGKPFICGLLLGLVLACDGETDHPGAGTPAQDLTGNWCGAAVDSPDTCLGDGVGYLELTQSGATVSGVACEAYGKDCYEVQSGAYVDGVFSYYYTFDSYRVDAELVLSNSKLTGTYHSDKCNCDLPLTFHAIP